MKVRILGSAAGGGCPQWNCACAVCAAARREGRQRTQDTVAVSGDGSAWYLINASPDIRTQLVSAPDLAPGPGLRQTPIRGVLLTTAELDHTVGLLSLREATALTVYATAAVRIALEPVRQMLAAYTPVDFQSFGTGLAGGLTVQRLTVGTKRPRYAAGLPGGDWVSALRLTDARTGSSFVYATCLPAWTEEFDEFLRGADEVLLDGTFGTDDELTRATGRPGSAASMGHLPIEASRHRRARHPGTRFRYGHLNNTNPAVGPDIATDGLVLPL
ncbi:pyrroloquinoline quinone biosynthesis protein PqqB [Actinoplanes sp. NPDC051343]|uniref:pyrroloquinoline quinone biosynthesis protein PqqB n=1 Tax=Actinoplanes sp. NPDC051343 TaxID=3363906 RepID=UPI0037A474C4